MDSHLYRIAARLAPTALATAILAACGGGGGGSMVRSTPPTIGDPQPNANPPTLCPEPLTADCVADVPAHEERRMEGGRSSDHALVTRGGTTRLDTGNFRFADGTRVESGSLVINSVATLRSDIDVAAPGWLDIWGNVEGNVVNRGGAILGARVDGNWTNHGLLAVIDKYYDPPPTVITGDFTQTSTGTLNFALGAGGLLEVEGRARIDGKLELEQYTDAWGPYPVPEAPLSHHLLTAANGVTGTFDAWTSASLFITGAVRYEANDIWFDASRISAQAAMRDAAAGDAMTLATAGAYDRVLAIADTMPRDAARLTAAQRRFLQSAATIQRIGDVAQAIRTFDSLSGHGHLAAVDAQLQHALENAPRIGAHAERVPLRASGAWSGPPDVASVRGASFAQSQAFGYDAWIGDRLLLGGRVDSTDSAMAVDRNGGVARGRAPAVHVSLHRVGDNGWHATGLLGASRQTMRLERPIDLGAARGAAMSERDTHLAYAWVETGRSVHTPVGTFTPYASLGYAAMHGAAFVEHGNTGFELAGLPSHHERLQGDAGLRYAKAWHRGADGWTRLGLGARWRHAFYAEDALQAAFTGAPQVVFDVAGMPMARTDRLWELDFTGGAGDRWRWALRYSDGMDDRALSLGMVLGF